MPKQWQKVPWRSAMLCNCHRRFWKQGTSGVHVGTTSLPRCAKGAWRDKGNSRWEQATCYWYDASACPSPLWSCSYCCNVSWGFARASTSSRGQSTGKPALTLGPWCDLTWCSISREAFMPFGDDFCTWMSTYETTLHRILPMLQSMRMHGLTGAILSRMDSHGLGASQSYHESSRTRFSFPA